ncbi:DUF4383 domain-containing protein [Mycobacterium neumannii]|uniref:DUF4383 domain-containing protein n=1 Tax=Mycobacterium neumannii TaxID=2048551 RepID=UPI003AB288B5
MAVPGSHGSPKAGCNRGRQGSPANFLPVNTADNWLHLGLAVGMLALGLLRGRTGDALDLRRG